MLEFVVCYQYLRANKFQLILAAINFLIGTNIIYIFFLLMLTQELLSSPRPGASHR